MTRATLRLTAGFALLVSCSAWRPLAFAYRPFDTTDAAVAEPKEIEIELEPVGYLQDGTDRTVIAPAIVFNYGVAESWELVVEGQGEHPVTGESRSSRVVGNGVFLKGVLRDGVLQEKRGISIATEFGALLPGINGDSGVGASMAGIGSLRTNGLTIHLNANVSVTRQGNPDLFLGTIVEGPIDWPVRPVAEAFYEREFSVSESASMLVGVIWQARSNRSFDFGLRSATVNNRHVSEIRAGLTYGFSA